MLPGSLREVIRAALSATPGLELGFVFGSVARGTTGPGSDLDVAVFGTVDTLELAGRLSLATDREVDIVKLEDAPIPLLEAILSEGIALFEREPGAEASFRSRTLLMLEIDRSLYDRMHEAWLTRVAERGILGQS
ncbi:MAG: nucleotidyltransferase domain-containing protein [Polyangiaceae bacterium]|nr:nucleotidyltransferase domain-containing protein [Polyangiaceae bacterium]MCW5789086.1 nucleotidyltransferase domain-containing protein [Polyangiaceae bacterium]